MPRSSEIEISLKDLKFIVEEEFEQILAIARFNFLCRNCRDSESREMVNYKIHLTRLYDVVFTGICKSCGGKVYRYLEIGEQPTFRTRAQAFKASLLSSRGLLPKKRSTKKLTSLHFNISLEESQPRIWRTFKVDTDYRFDRFHQVIQIVMGWNNSHLHEFDINGYQIGMDLQDIVIDATEVADETKIYLRDFKWNPGDVLYYSYDFGDDWIHRLELIETSEAPLPLPVCTGGENACPPEDCGGIGGYYNLLQILKDPNDPEYQDWMDWLPEGFEPYKFEQDAVNNELGLFGAWHKKHPRKKASPWHQI